MKTLKDLVLDVSRVLDTTQDESVIIPFVRGKLSLLVKSDNWLDDAFKIPDSDKYSSYLLYCDPVQRFVIESSVFRPGKGTPVHNHTIWGAIGVLRGVERTVTYEKRENGRLKQCGEPKDLSAGETTSVSPNDVDIHSVMNPSSKDDSVSIHVYGGHIGRVSREMFDLATGKQSPFVAPYTNRFLPNIWL